MYCTYIMVSRKKGQTIYSEVQSIVKKNTTPISRASLYLTLSYLLRSSSSLQDGFLDVIDSANNDSMCGQRRYCNATNKRFLSPLCCFSLWIVCQHLISSQYLRVPYPRFPLQPFHLLHTAYLYCHRDKQNCIRIHNFETFIRSTVNGKLLLVQYEV